MRTEEAIRHVPVAVTYPSRHERGKLNLHGAQTVKLAAVDRWSQGLDPKGDQLVAVLECTHDTLPEDDSRGVRFYRVRPVFRSELREAKLVWRNSSHFSDDETGLIYHALAANLQRFCGRIGHTNVARLLLRMWRYTDLTDLQLYNLFNKPVVVREFNPEFTYRRKACLAKNVLAAFDDVVFINQTWRVQREENHSFKKAERFNCWEKRYQAALATQRELLAHHPLWRWFDSQADALKEVLLANVAEAPVPEEVRYAPLAFFEWLKPLEVKGPSNSCQPQNLINGLYAQK